MREIVDDRVGSASPSWDERPGLREHLSLYRRLIGARSRGLMQYKFSFFLQVLNTVFATIVDFVEILVIFGRIPALGGWSLGEVAVLYGMASASFGLAETFSVGFEALSRSIVQGTFDRILTRPLGAFFQVFASDFAPRKLGRVVQGLIILVLAAHALGIHWSADRVAVLGVALVSGGVIFFAIFVVGAAATFWTVQSNEVVNIFTNGGVMLASYPLEIYQGWLRRLVTFVVPLGFVDYYPALYLLGRTDPLGLPSWMGLLAPLVAVVLALVAAATWSAGVRHYSSVGN